MSRPSKLESDVCYRVYGWRHLMKATEVTAGLAECNGSLPPGGWIRPSHLRADCLYIGISSGWAQRSVTSRENFTFHLDYSRLFFVMELLYNKSYNNSTTSQNSELLQSRDCNCHSCSDVERFLLRVKEIKYLIIKLI